MKLAVIMPVYGDFSLTSACLDSVIQSKVMNATDFRLLVIYDCSGDKDIEQYLDNLEAAGLIELHKNLSNLGFVKTVNRGFSYTEDADCIILNSDTLVNGDWIDRLVSVADSDPAIGTITPYTNNGEICSFPEICKDNVLPEFTTFAEIDRAFSRNYDEAIIDLPTGVGFCMYVSRQALKAAGNFDEGAFGKGYGEENDLCQRFAKLGYRNVLAPNIFVYHSGGASFGEKKQQLINNAMTVINNRYPDYAALVSVFIENDLPQYTRFKTMARLMAESDKPSILMICHGLGGGTGRYVDELCDFFHGAANFFRLTPSQNKRVSLSFPAWCGLDPLSFSIEENYDNFIDLLQSLSLNLIHINHIKGYEFLVSRLIKDMALRYIFTLHDYYLVSGNPVLTGGNGIHDSQIALDPQLRHKDFDRHIRFCSYQDWLSLGEILIEGAHTVIAPCRSIVDIFQGIYPNASYLVTPHLDTQQLSVYPDVYVRPTSSEALKKVVVLGALSQEKGADILEQVADLARENGLNIEFHLVGYGYRRLSSNVIVTGPYAEEDLPALLDKINPDLIWFPSRWAETYSYTLSAAFLAACPVMVPEFGAQYVRSSGRPQTTVFTSYEAKDLLDTIQTSLSSLDQHQGKTIHWQQDMCDGFSYLEDYLWLAEPNAERGRISDELAVACLDNYRPPELTENFKKKLLRLLVMIRMSRMGATVSRLVPLSLQKKIKRMLFRGSVHEL
ncbi:glycosyltransferase [Oceanicoccus sp. KOV_DT_Chl]|uniref:glycosyltransferase n=1 Tax=Oceanicoccus sp. KOV_DT_Chl TaxID=1904639 RepID=UPI000C7E0F36|nr:glycosyltransferase [Oceanicoccus sp. KOV_DT_Chl]